MAGIVAQCLGVVYISAYQRPNVWKLSSWLALAYPICVAGSSSEMAAAGLYVKWRSLRRRQLAATLAASRHLGGRGGWRQWRLEEALVPKARLAHGGIPFEGSGS